MATPERAQLRGVKVYQRFIVPLLVRPDGLLEMVVLAGSSVLSWIEIAITGAMPSLTTLAAEGVLLWALYVAREAPRLAVGSLGVIGAAILINGSLTIPIAAGVLFLFELLLANRLWASSTATAVLYLLGISVAVNLTGADVPELSLSGADLVVLSSVGLACAFGVAMSRISVELSLAAAKSERKLALEQQKLSLAKGLHDNVADSLTRIVLLAEKNRSGTELIQTESRKAVEELMRIMRQLNGEPGISHRSEPFLDLVKDGRRMLEEAGFSVAIEEDGQMGVMVDRDVANAIREMFTNVLKHGQSPVRIMVDNDEATVQLLIANNYSLATSQAGAGLGIQNIREVAAARGGTFSTTSSSGAFHSYLEVPQVNPVRAEV